MHAQGLPPAALERAVKSAQSSDMPAGAFGMPDVGMYDLNPPKQLKDLSDVLKNLHYTMSNHDEKPMRLVRLDAVAKWGDIRMYEDLSPDSYLEVKYATTDDVWAETLVLSWKWGINKPATRPKVSWSPMEPQQKAEFKALIAGAIAGDLKYAWIDWCCNPQYPSGSEGNAAVMVEIIRSKVLMSVLAVFAQYPASPPF